MRHSSRRYSGAQRLSQLRRLLTGFAWCLAALYATDRAIKLLAVHRFLRRPQPPAPAVWPSVTLLQPITRGASDLPGALARRAALAYQGELQHLLVCDGADAGTVRICQSWLADQPSLNAQLLILDAAPVATKIEKLRAALPHASSQVLVFVDDDILLRPDAIDQLVRHLEDHSAGAVFGLAVYTNWSNIPTSLLSAFVNANALLSYVPLTYLADPYTITGHLYALHREVFAAVDGLDGMEGRFDDDHELARRIQRCGLKNVQTPVIYDVDNYLPTLNGYTNQMRRWFIIPRQTMAPFLTPYQQVVSLIGSAGNLIPPLLGMLTLLGGLAAAPFVAAMTLYAAVYALCEHAYLARTTPFTRWPWVLLSALIAPLQALGGFLGGSDFSWRGQHIRLHPGGRYDILPHQASGKPPLFREDLPLPGSLDKKPGQGIFVTRRRAAKSVAAQRLPRAQPRR